MGGISSTEYQREQHTFPLPTIAEAVQNKARWVNRRRYERGNTGIARRVLWNTSCTAPRSSATLCRKSRPQIPSNIINLLFIRQPDRSVRENEGHLWCGSCTSVDRIHAHTGTNWAVLFRYVGSVRGLSHWHEHKMILPYQFPFLLVPAQTARSF